MGTVIGAGIGSRIPQGMTLQKLGFEPFSETESYAVGDVVVYEGDIYKFNAAHPAGAWIGTDADKTSVAELIACGGQGLPVEHEIPEEGMLPDVRYVLDVSSTPSLDITLQPGTPGRAATYHLVFRIFDDIPSITWPEGMYGAPTLEEEMLYEIDITDDGTYIIANAYSVSVPYTANKIRYKTTDDSELEISFDGLNLKKSVFDGEYWNAQFDGVITEVKYNSINDYRLKEVILPSQLTTIGEYAFQSCSALTSVTIPDSVTTIGNSTFYGCRALTSVTIPDSVTTIGDWAFYACSALTSVTIPDSVITIGEYAFVGCEALTSVTIQDSVTTIGNSTFYGCSALTSVTVLATTPPTLGGNASRAFSGSYPVYVPAASVNSYKTASNWTSISSRITAIPE